MNPGPGILIGLMICLNAIAEEDHPIRPDEAMGSLRVWMDENLDDWVFEAASLDRERVDQWLTTAGEQLEQVEEPFPEAENSRVEPGNQAGRGQRGSAGAGSEEDGNSPGREDADEMLNLLAGFEPAEALAHWLRASLDQPHPTPALSAPTAPSEALTPPAAPDLQTLWLRTITRRPEPSAARDYLPQIKPIFEAEQVPSELAWIAEVESAFNPDARSPVGAVGLFQLMPETARSLGLSTWLPDERRDAEKNARAAARYLQHLHDRFSDWPLALAAYNAGPTRVSKLLRESGSYSFEAIADRLPSETRDYVAKVAATLLVREGVELASLAPSRR